MENNEMILLDFTLRKKGMRMDYRVQCPVKRGGLQMVAEKTEKSPFPPSGKIIRLIESVKPFACKMLGLWQDSFNAFLDENGLLKEFSESMYGENYNQLRSTLEAVEIVTVKFNGGYRFICMVETIPGKRMKMTSPVVSDEDDLYMEMEEIMSELVSVTIDFLSSVEYDVKAEARSIVERSLPAELVEGMSEKELFLYAVENIEKLGGVVMYSEELERELSEARLEVPIIMVAKGDTDVDGVKGDRKEELAAWAEKERDYDEKLRKRRLRRKFRLTLS